MNTKLYTTLLATSASLFATIGAAQAQEMPAATAHSSNATATEARTAADEPMPGTIVVTATRRAERLQDVPIAVAAISGEQLAEAGFQSLQDIQYQFSGVQFGNSPNDPGFRLRGVGTAGGFTSASEQNVGTVVDNVVIPFGNPVASLGDVDRVEVLKGPQGTQFGKNSSSGVINITTRRPDLNEFGGSAFFSYAELDEHAAHGSLNIPIAPGIAALNVYAFHREHDGFLENVVRNELWGATENYGVRAKLLWEPSDDFGVYVIGDWSRSKRFGPSQLWSVNRLRVPTDLAVLDPGGFALTQARFAAITALGIIPGFDNDESAEEYPGFGGEDNYGASIELNYGFGADYNLTSIIAYRKLDDHPSNFAIDATPFPILNIQQGGGDQSLLSQELRVTSPSGEMLEYVAGVYASRRRSSYGSTLSSQFRPALPFSAVPQLSISAGLSTMRTQTKSAAVFADGSFRLSEMFRLLGGLRYSYDWVKAESFSVVDPAFPPGAGPNGFTIPYSPRPLATGSTNKGDWSGRAGIEFKPNDDLLFFGTVARGYLGPTVTFSNLTGTRAVADPQTVIDVTVGANTQFFGRVLTLNGNVFWNEYKNLQTSVFNGLEFLTENAGGFEAKGFEIQAVVRPNRQLSFHASYTYSDTEFTDYVTSCPNAILAQSRETILATCNAPGSIAPDPANVANDPRQIGRRLFQAAGFPLAGAPKHSVTAGADLNMPVGDTFALDASVNYYYRSKAYYDVGNPLSTQRGYSTVGAALGFGDRDRAWRVAAFARNLFDERFHAAVIGLPFSPPGSTVNWLTREGRRTIGGSVEVRF